jgi:hypothetical protein
MLAITASLHPKREHCRDIRLIIMLISIMDGRMKELFLREADKPRFLAS